MQSYFTVLLAVSLIYTALTRRREANGAMETRKRLKQVNCSRLLSKHDIIYMAAGARAFWFNGSAPRGRHPHSNDFLSGEWKLIAGVSAARGTVPFGNLLWFQFRFAIRPYVQYLPPIHTITSVSLATSRSHQHLGSVEIIIN